MKEKSKKLFYGVLGFVKLSVYLILTIGILYIIHKLGWISFEDFERILKIVIWPVTVISVLFFFQKVFTFMFFSMDRFNFFGAQGTLKNVEQVVEENVERRVKEEQEREELKNEIQSMRGDKERVEFLTVRYLESLRKERQSRRFVGELQAQISALLQQIQKLQVELIKQSNNRFRAK